MLAERLHARGGRLTPQRRLIVAAFERRQGHVSAEDLLEELRAVQPGLPLSTVYRTLLLLEELGLARHMRFADGVVRYHRAEDADHQHIVCQSCGGEWEVPLAILAPVAERLRAEYDFEPDLTHSAIVGLCAACRNGTPTSRWTPRSHEAPADEHP